MSEKLSTYHSHYGLDPATEGYDEVVDALRVVYHRGHSELRAMGFKGFDVTNMSVSFPNPFRDGACGCYCLDVSGIEQAEIDFRKSVAWNTEMAQWFPDNNRLADTVFDGGRWWIEDGEFRVSVDKTSPKVKGFLEAIGPEAEKANAD